MNNVLQAKRLLQISLFLILIIAGLDKFFNVLTSWEQYFPIFIEAFSPLSVKQLSFGSGVVEVICSLLLLVRVRLGSILASVIFGGIIITLIFVPGYLNIMLVDFGLLCASLALFKLSHVKI